MEKDDLSSYFPNSPKVAKRSEPGSSPQSSSQGDEVRMAGYLSNNPAMEKTYWENEIIELPSPPSVRRYSPGRTDKVKVGLIGFHISDALRDSYEHGGNYREDFSHWLGCLQALSIDSSSLTELKKLRAELDKTNDLERHRKIIFQEARTLILGLRPGRKG